jgi:hypothetical protein
MPYILTELSHDIAKNKYKMKTRVGKFRDFPLSYREMNEVSQY